MHTHCSVCYQSENYLQVVSPSFLIPTRESDGIFERKKKEGTKEKGNRGREKKKKEERKEVKEARRTNSEKGNRGGPQKKKERKRKRKERIKEREGPKKKGPHWHASPTSRLVSSCHRQDCSLTCLLPSPLPPVNPSPPAIVKTLP
jgi:hypothetical protein